MAVGGQAVDGADGEEAAVGEDAEMVEVLDAAAGLVDDEAVEARLARSQAERVEAAGAARAGPRLRPGDAVKLAAVDADAGLAREELRGRLGNLLDGARLEVEAADRLVADADGRRLPVLPRRPVNLPGAGDGGDPRGLPQVGAEAVDLALRRDAVGLLLLLPFH